jgi:hypothetical protein
VAQLIKRGYVKAVVDKKRGNKRKLYLTTTMTIPIDKNVHTPTDKNVQQNNTDKILQKNKITPYVQKLSGATVQDQAYHLLLRYGVDHKVAQSIVYEQQTPPESIQEAVTNGLAKHKYESGFVITPGYIVAALNGARKEGKVVSPTKKSKVLKAHIDRLFKNKTRKPMSKGEFTQRKETQKKLLAAAS